MSKPESNSSSTKPGSILGGITDILERLGDLADKGEQLAKHGELHVRDQGGKGAFDISLNIDVGDCGSTPEQQQQPAPTNRPQSPPVRQPVVEINADADCTQITVELPGIGLEDVVVTFAEDVMLLAADNGKRKYGARVRLAERFCQADTTMCCENGILDIRCRHQCPSPPTHADKNKENSAMQPSISQQSSKQAFILIVEDNPADVELMVEALREVDFPNHIKVCKTGESALEYLCARRPDQQGLQNPVPDFMLLDIKLPGMSGFDVLTKVKQHPVVKYMPVIMLTSSKEPQDRQHAYDECANSYLVKPVEFSNLIALLEDVLEYWVSTNVPAI